MKLEAFEYAFSNEKHWIFRKNAATDTVGGMKKVNVEIRDDLTPLRRQGYILSFLHNGRPMNLDELIAENLATVVA